MWNQDGTVQSHPSFLLLAAEAFPWVAIIAFDVSSAGLVSLGSVSSPSNKHQSERKWPQIAPVEV